MNKKTAHRNEMNIIHEYAEMIQQLTTKEMYY